MLTLKSHAGAFAVMALLVGFVGKTEAVSIPVTDYSFEQATSLSGWTGGGPGAGQSVIGHASSWIGDGGCGWGAPGQYPGLTSGSTDGDIYAYFNGRGSVTQTLDQTLQPNTTYTLSVDVGYRNDLDAYASAFPRFQIELLAGGHSLINYSDRPGGAAISPGKGTWTTAMATFTTPATVAPNQSLGIKLYGYGIQTDYDNIHLDAVPASRPAGSFLEAVTKPVTYFDSRPYPSYRMNAQDQGNILTYGNGPNSCDIYGAREALINKVDGKYYLYYDGAGLDGWRACLAESTDLTTWTKKGPILSLGAPGTPDSGSASAPWIIKDDNNLWHMYYLGTNVTNGDPGNNWQKIPGGHYLTLHATSVSPEGPWTKDYNPITINIKPNTYYSETAAPGCVVKNGNEYMMFFSPSEMVNGILKRTIGIARATDLNGVWTPDPAPALPQTEQIENSSLYYEQANQTWFMFTNHVGYDSRGEFTDGIWVYWTKDLNTWNPANKAVVLDGLNCDWSSSCIGMPSVVQDGDKLRVFYDAPGGDSVDHMFRSLGMATLQLPLTPATVPEPNATILLLFGGLILWGWKCRKLRSGQQF